MKYLCFYAVLLLLVINVYSCKQDIRGVQVSSPDNTLTLSVKSINGTLCYSLIDKGDTIVEDSKLGFKFQSGPDLDGDIYIVSTQKTWLNEVWEPVWGQQRQVINNYNGVKVRCSENNKSARVFDVEFRVFNDGIGFRYSFPKQNNMDSVVIMDEYTQFNMSDDYLSWWMPASEPYYESIARHSRLSKMDTVNTPLTIERGDKGFISIHEANLTDYAKMKIAHNGTSLKCELVPWSNGVKVYAKTPFVTPWRTIVVAKTPGELVTSTLMLNLNEPCKIADVSWIKPAKYMGIWWSMHLFQETWSEGPTHGATTANCKRYIDFAAANGIQGVLAEGWNVGWNGSWTKKSDSISFTKCVADFDLKQVTSYAESKGVAWIGHHETAANTINYESQMDSAFALYSRNGVHYVKTGYVNVLMDGKELHDSQYGVRHYRKVVETAAKYQICIDNHEPVMPTGIDRTWPNLMTQEGVRGQEYDAWSPDGGNPPEHTTVLPFLRGLAGPMDYTFGTFNFANPVNPGSRVQSTISRELAHFVVIYSPLQMASDLPENYAGNKAFNFIRDVPTDWDKTVVPQAVIGDYAVFARKDKNSADWYVGVITDETPRSIDVTLSFLQPDKKYLAQIYADGDDADWKTNPTSFKYEEMEVTSLSVINVKMASGGGCAIRFVSL